MNDNNTPDRATQSRCALATGSDSGISECAEAHRIASHACEEQQPMPSEGVNSRLIAEACETIGEGYAARRRWFDCSTAHRMACWYWRKAIDE